jgi:hypothetical protein
LSKVRSFLLQLPELFRSKETFVRGLLLNHTVLVAEILDPLVLTFLHNF